MNFTFESKNFVAGGLLEASQLNEMKDFCVQLALCSFIEQSDGILSGLYVRKVQATEELILEKGFFKINGKIGNLSKNLSISLPEIGEFFLVLQEESEEEIKKENWQLIYDNSKVTKQDCPIGIKTKYKLSWLSKQNLQKENSIILCRIDNTSLTIKEHWIFTDEKPRTPFELLNYINYTSYIQLEYAQFSSKGCYPTLFPRIQKQLAQMCDEHNLLTLSLSNGLLSLEDIFKTNDRKVAIHNLCENFVKQENTKVQNVQNLQKSQKSQKRNYAG